ncbi:MAG: NUDIX domain-containing protein [Dehalococcoidia bacterium]
MSEPDNRPRLGPGAAVLLMDRAGRVLLQQRDDIRPPAGYGRWAIPGGGIDAGETPRDAALREFEEETGVRLERLRFHKTLTYDGPDSVVIAQHVFFADDLVDPATIQVNEGLDFRFWAPDEVEGLLMNPFPREVLRGFFASDHYRGTLRGHDRYKEGACVVALDRWGRVLLQLRDADLPPERYPDHWSLLGGLIEPGEAPDLAALREFEEETGILLDDVRLYRAFRRTVDLPEALVDIQHVYFADPDIPEEQIDVREGQAMRYFAEHELGALLIPPHTRTILAAFFGSPAYRALFH